MKKTFLIMMALIVMFSTVAVWANGKQEEKQTEKYRIGLSWFSMSEEYLANLYSEIEAYLERSGLDNQIDLILLDASMDAAKQNSQVDNLIAQNVDVIIMVPFDKEQQGPAVEAACVAGIPLIELCASTAASDKRSAYVGSDDLASGRILMQHLAEVSGGKGNIVMLHGPAGQNAEIMRNAGAEEVLADYPEMKVVAHKYCNWDRALAMTSMENVIQSGIEFNIVFAQDDGMGLGSLEALSGSGVENVIVGSIDGTPDALNAVKDGRLVCTVFQDSKAQAVKAVDVALEAAKGNSIDKMYDIEYILITQDNVNEYLE